MNKIELNPELAPFPKPTALIGALVDGRPNFMDIVWFNRMNRSPNIWGASLNKKHHTLKGIRQNNTFSINLPDTSLVAITDYCGLVSGKDVDKSKLFEIFYGFLKSAPMIAECPVCFECVVHDYVELSDHVIVLGEVKHIYTDERYLTEGVLDPKKMDPIIFTKRGSDGTYWTIGNELGQAWSIGKEIGP